MQVTYEKGNGDIVQRYVGFSSYKVGEVTGQGWRVVDIKYKYKNKYYSSAEYNELLNKEWEHAEKIRQMKRISSELYKDLTHGIVFLVLLKQILLTTKNFL